MYPQSHTDLITREVAEGLLVHDERAAKVHVLNRSAARVLALCDGSHDAEAIAGILAFEGGVPLERARADVEAVLADFRRLDLIA